MQQRERVTDNLEESSDMADDTTVRHLVEQLRQNLDMISMFSEGRHKVLIEASQQILDDLAKEADPKVYTFTQEQYDRARQLHPDDLDREADLFAQNEAREDGIADHQRS